MSRSRRNSSSSVVIVATTISVLVVLVVVVELGVGVGVGVGVVVVVVVGGGGIGGGGIGGGGGVRRSRSRLKSTFLKFSRESPMSPVCAFEFEVEVCTERPEAVGYGSIGWLRCRWSISFCFSCGWYITIAVMPQNASVTNILSHWWTDEWVWFMPGRSSSRMPMQLADNRAADSRDILGKMAVTYCHLQRCPRSAHRDVKALEEEKINRWTKDLGNQVSSSSLPFWMDRSQ